MPLRVEDQGESVKFINLPLTPCSPGKNVKPDLP
jgi:hypothetical protein